MKIRGAISGFGEVAARAHLAGWRTRANLSIVAVHDPIAERRHEAIRLVKNVRVYDDLALMLDGERPDFVDVASPPAIHAATARAALAAGAHVIVEKPLCLTLGEFDELVAMAGAGGRALMCVHNWKFAPAYAAARRAIESGRLGQIYSVAFERLRTAPAGVGGSGGRWRAAAALGGGILIDHGWHVFYLMQWLFGGAAPEAVSARLESPVESSADDLAELQVEFAGGRRARAYLSWRAAVRRTWAAIQGTEGAIEIEGDRVTLTGRTGACEDLSVADLPDDSYHSAWFAGVAQEFESAMATGPAAPQAQANLVQARAALGLIVAARKSSSNGGTKVKIPTK